MQVAVALPFVSVIVPVYNDAQRIVTCVRALLAQNYPQDRYEVLVVDNGSTDATFAAVQAFPVTLLSENDTQSSFAARNKGIAHARGEIFAFTDADCTPSPQWIAEGVRAIQAGADLVGGRVRFVYSSRPTSAEVYDSISHMQMDRDISERGVAKTANVFARAEVVARIGPFPNDFSSGGDVLWTRRATTSGYKLVYSPSAEVAHPTRRLRALLKKQYRVGRGHHDIRTTERSRAAEATSRRSPQAPQGGLLHKIVATLYGLLPGSISDVRASMRRNGVEGLMSVYRVWLVAWLCRVVMTLGSLSRASTKHWQSRRTYATK